MNLRQKPNAILFVLAVLFFTVTALTAWAAIEPGDPDSGIWELSATQDCGAGLICVEWTYTVFGNKTADDACCMDPSWLGSTQFKVCTAGFRHDPH